MMESLVPVDVPTASRFGNRVKSVTLPKRPSVTAADEVLIVPRSLFCLPQGAALLSLEGPAS